MNVGYATGETERSRLRSQHWSEGSTKGGRVHSCQAVRGRSFWLLATSSNALVTSSDGLQPSSVLVNYESQEIEPMGCELFTEATPQHVHWPPRDFSQGMSWVDSVASNYIIGVFC